MKSITVEVSPLVEAFLDKQEIQNVLENEAKRRWHCQRSRKLTPEEKELRSFLGNDAYGRLTPAEKERMLSCVELSK
jgi:hypothetical protein